MTVFAVDKNNDLYINQIGQMAINTDLAAVMQTCEHAVKTQLGELVLNIDEGLPSFSLIWNGAPNIPQALAALRTILENVDNVIEVESLSAVVKDNIFYYNATIKTNFGTGSLNGGI